jgi:hypothetical protein
VQRGGRERQEPKLRQWLAAGAASTATQAAVIEYFKLEFETIARML